MNRRKMYFSTIAMAAILGLGVVSCKKPVESVTLDKTTLTLVETESATLVATVLPEKAANKSVTWSSSNPLVASVMPNGFVTAISKGTTLIMVVSTEDGNKTATCVVQVVERVPVTNVILNKNSLTLEAGKSETLIATVLPDNANDKTVTWKSSNPAVATVANGLVTAKANGEAIITVTTNDGNKTANCIVRIGFHPAEPEMVLVEGGTFTMGCTDGDCKSNELPTHQVTLSSFKMAKYLVTQKQWAAIMGSNPSSKQGDDLPVTNVSWDDAQEFIRRLNDTTGKQYRLPTEAEWEYAARGGKQSQGYKYSGSNNLDDVAWNGSNSGGNPNPVGRKLPNELGIYDMSGNVWEWCSDWYDVYTASPQTNPKGPATGTDHVNRGGAYHNTVVDGFCRVACRGVRGYLYQGGFRLVHP